MPTVVLGWTVNVSQLIGNAITNAITSRGELWGRFFGERRKDIDAECGHPISVSIEDCKKAYQRGDVAKRCVDVYPQETWCDEPEIIEQDDEEETEFEEAWNILQKKFRIFSVLQRADILSGIGRFGIIILGVKDGKLSEELSLADEDTAATERELLYIRPFDESLVTINKVETREDNPRMGQPIEYNVQFADTNSTGMFGATLSLRTLKVHWTRVIHIADNRADSDVLGVPRLECVYNRLLDLKKIVGSSAEMFWKGGFPGIAIEANPVQPGVSVNLDKEATKEEVEDYFNGLSRAFTLVGMTAKSLAPQVADPKSHMETQIRCIAIAMSVPWRILMGVEVGQLAGEQDMKGWNRKLQRRRDDYVGPYIIRPFVERLIAAGVLPPLRDGNELKITWPDLNTPTDDEKATVLEKRTNAMAKYVQADCVMVMPPHQWLTMEAGYTDEQAKAILEEAEGQESLKPEEPEPEVVVAPGMPAGRNGNGKPVGAVK